MGNKCTNNCLRDKLDVDLDQLGMDYEGVVENF